MSDTAGQLLQEGRLADSIEAAAEAVRRSPASAAERILLAELLVLGGQMERADAVLDAAGALDPEAALPAAEFRQLLRAATARRQVLREGRLPEFLGEPTIAQRFCLQALLALREHDAETAADAARAAEAARPPAPGDADGVPFADWRDADDLWAGSLEVLTTTGRYFWLPAERVTSLQFHPPARPRDLAWRRCTIAVQDGPEGEVCVPAIYEAEGEQDDALRLGRRTSWSDREPVRGAGQRVFLLGEEGVAVQQLGALAFR